MKKVGVLFFSACIFIGSLFPGTNFSEFSELPSLIKHYQYHRKIETPGIRFVDFMLMHYANYKHAKSDPLNHSKLPVHHGFASVISDKMLTSAQFIKKPLAIRCNSVSLFYNRQHFIHVNFIDTIFHPPKV